MADDRPSHAVLAATQQPRAGAAFAAHSPPHAPQFAAVVSLIDTTAALASSSLTALHAQANAAAAHLQATGEVRVRIIDDAEMTRLHAQHCNDPTPTDVLTFDLRDDAHAHSTAARAPLDTDIVVCLGVAQAQAAARGHTPERELLLYIVHGMLHCLGHDDHADEDFQRMHRTEDEVLAAIGVGPTFARDLAPNDRSASPMLGGPAGALPPGGGANP